MRLVNFEEHGAPRLGILQAGDRVTRLIDVAPGLPQELGALLQLGPSVFSQIIAALVTHPDCETRPLSSLRLLPPAPVAGKILCLGLNYLDHAAESKMDRPQDPVIFLRTASSLVGHGGAIVCPAISNTLDFEGELVAIIGKRARHVQRSAALEHVAGYSIFNDGSIREYQRRTTQWTVGKNFDATGAFGPVFVSADELPAGAKGLRIETILNGVTMQDANTSDMIFDVAETIAFLSGCMTLEPGDVLVMGTPAGVGAARKPPVWMKPHDTVEVRIERIGTLTNHVAAEEPVSSAA
ncbi:fumarylacetoacetate hydrolase family protein [Afipia massiliensis]|uniref:Fumarylacetoacetate hydrolase family protein n=1 Tax=Afipia massiliensis TaxID=211460 RepID=A0A4U6BMJ0_9BRAD|nr:fumarylacetoacetate hydrolase family protein [Afipia massiliensis]TKT71549.1 fumarylacetoacetate hydrolase family protein [Afipia massiliensis]